jgi:two-component system NtrC family sensor kinase
MEALDPHVHAMFQQIPSVAIQGYEKDGTTRFWNKASEQLYGYTAREAIGRNLLDLIIPPEMRDIATRSIRQMIETGNAIPPGELDLMRKDGTKVTVFSSHAVTTSPDGVPQLLCIDIDLTAHRKAETALHESEARHRSILNASPDAIAITDLTGRISMVSPAALPMFRCETVDDLQGRLITDFMIPGDVERARSNIALMFQGIMTGPGEYRGTCTDGSHFDMEANAEFIRGIDGQPASMVFVVRDITARKQAESILRLRGAALEAAANAIFITDREGLIQWANPAFTTITGYSAAEAIGRNPGELLKSGKHEPGFYQDLWKTILAGEVWCGEMINRRKDGSLYTEEMTITSVPDEHGKISHFIAVKQDVTQRKLLEEQFRQSQKMEAFGQLAGGVAHDFNNILAAMMLQAEIIGMADGLSDEVRQGLQQIRTDAARAANLTRQLLLFSRKQVLQTHAVDLNEVVTHLSRMLLRVIGEDMHLQLDLHPRPLITRADSGMLDQLLLNLVINARDAMPRGGRIVIETDAGYFTREETASSPDAKPGNHVILRVTDTGTGIEPENLPRIFEPFFTTKEPGKGTGLGLPTVFGIVKQHGGWLTVESVVGSGTTFRIHLPASENAETRNRETAQTNSCEGTETILLVEDEPALRVLTGMVLRRHGYQVLEAEQGVAALRVWNEHSGTIDLLLTDLVMPDGIGGMELAARLRERSGQLRVIFTSGYNADISGRELSLQSGQLFIQKPASPALLLETVRRCLDG